MNVKAKIEKRMKALEEKYPELLWGQVWLGTGNHPDLFQYERAKKVVGYEKIQKYKQLRFVLKKWEQCETKQDVALNIGTLLRQNNWYSYAKQLKQEMRGSDVEKI